MFLLPGQPDEDTDEGVFALIQATNRLEEAEPLMRRGVGTLGLFNL